MQDEIKPPSSPIKSGSINLGVNLCESDSILPISLSLPINDSSCSSSSSSSSSLSPHLHGTIYGNPLTDHELSTPDSGRSSLGGDSHPAHSLAGLSPLLPASLSLSPSPNLWSSSNSASSPEIDHGQRRPITAAHNLAHSPRSGPSSPSNFLLPGVVNANKSLNSPWSSSPINGLSSPTNQVNTQRSPTLSPWTTPSTAGLSPPAGQGLWNRGRSAPNLANLTISTANFGVSPFSASNSTWSNGCFGGPTSPVPSNRKPSPIFGNHLTGAYFPSPSQGGGRFRRSTSYPGKNNIFGAASNQLPTLEVTNIDEANDYMYQDPFMGNMGAGPLENMRSLDYVLQEIMPHHETDIFKGRNYYAALDGSSGELGFHDDSAPGPNLHLTNLALNGMAGLNPQDGFGLNGSLNYLGSMASPSRVSPRSPSSTTGSDGGERYSRKVFVGGLPPDIDEEEINASFRRFGALVVDWPHKAESKSYFPPKGYAFLLFQEESSVQRLIESCIQEEDKLYLYVSSPTIKDKAVQIRPWKLSDADFVLDASLPLDPRKTVFVGGVPRPLKAVELALIMDRLYGGVCYAGIDIDPELKYPKGAGRVAFSNQQSYIAAISARFVQLQHGDIDKRVEVKPYVLDDQFCDECQGARSAGRFAPFFCANITCLQYYCEHCWAVIHSHPGREFHKPLVKEGADRPRTVHFRW